MARLRNIVLGMALTALIFVPKLFSSAPAQAAHREFSLEAETPQLWKLVDRNAKLKLVAGGFKFTEGPVWDKSGFLYFSDEKGNRIYRLYPDGRKELVIEIGDPDGNTFDRQGRLIDCTSVLRAVVEITPGGKYKILADHFEGMKLNTPNDVVTGPDGALYFTNPNMDLVAGAKQEIPYQGVYRLSSDGGLRLLTKNLTQPNGLAFSPDGKRFYVDDSDQRNIRVYDFTREATITNGRIFGEEPGREDDGVPDGMKVDIHGNLYVVGPKGIWVWDADGKHIGTIVMPEQPANLAWGDKDYRTLYITATTSVYRLRMKVRGFVPYL